MSKKNRGGISSGNAAVPKLAEVLVNAQSESKLMSRNLMFLCKDMACTDVVAVCVHLFPAHACVAGIRSNDFESKSGLIIEKIPNAVPTCLSAIAMTDSGERAFFKGECAKIVGRFCYVLITLCMIEYYFSYCLQEVGWFLDIRPLSTKKMPMIQTILVTREIRESMFCCSENACQKF